jgi:F-type H+-transporting ATPase subunit a
VLGQATAQLTAHTTATLALPRSEVPFPPSVEDFFLPPVAGEGPWFTKITLLVWASVAILIIFFLVAYRKPQMVPGRTQWLAESMYGFVRNNIAVEMIGKDGVRFAPYLATLFFFILVNNFYGILPGAQLSPMSHIAFPAMLAAVSYVLFIAVGIRKHGLGGYLKHAFIPPAPGFILPLLIPIEALSNFVIRPFSLAVRLFANMFAGHMLLLVFTLGGFAMINANALFAPISVLSWAMTVAITLLEALVVMLQAYVFTVLTASYVQGSLAEGH